MDLVLDYVDPLYLDKVYSDFFPSTFQDRDFWVRQYISILVIWIIGGWIAYLGMGAFSYVVFFDKNLKNHKLFLPNQMRQEITVAMTSIPLMALPSALIFVAEVRGYSKLYDTFDYAGLNGYVLTLLTIPFYLLFTDAGIYWIHRILHWPAFYGPIHKLHHRWIVCSPFASHAFHPLDGFLQSVPYHIYVFLFPINKVLYMAMFLFVNMWTVSIHDEYHFYSGKILNGAEHHTIHHRQFLYNYGQYFTLWDRMCGTHKLTHNSDSGKKAQ